MDFKEIEAIYGKELPSQEVFFSDGKHYITPREVARHYGERRIHTAWDTFVADYTKRVATKPAAAKKAEKPAKES